MSDKLKKTADLVEYRKGKKSVMYPREFAEKNDAHLRADHWYPVEPIKEEKKEEPKPKKDLGEEPATSDL